MQQFAGLAISRSRGSFIPDGLYDSSWDGVTPMTGKYTTNYFNYKSDVGGACSTTGSTVSTKSAPTTTITSSSSRRVSSIVTWKLSVYKRSQAYLLVCGDDGKLRPVAENICSLTHAVCTTAPRGDFTAGTFLVSLSFFISCILRTVYNNVFEAHYFQLTLSGIRKDGKQLLPDYDKFIPFDVPNHDDWNDLFNDPVKLEDKLILSDRCEGQTHAHGGLA